MTEIEISVETTNDFDGIQDRRYNLACQYDELGFILYPIDALKHFNGNEKLSFSGHTKKDEWNRETNEKVLELIKNENCNWYYSHPLIVCFDIDIGTKHKKKYEQSWDKHYEKFKSEYNGTLKVLTKNLGYHYPFQMTEKQKEIEENFRKDGNETCSRMGY